MFEIHFNDLVEDIQQRFFNPTDISQPEETNWDVFPVTEAIIGR
jgi:hypothetical protein